MPLVSKAFGDIITFTRASTGTYFDSAGVLQSAAIDAPRLDYDPATLAAQGLLIEEARTNSIRNNTMVGAVAGTPGTLPTNWQTFTSLTGLTREIVGIGTENGITYIDIRLSGTPSAAGAYNIFQESVTATAATSGQTWAFTQYSKLAAGSTSGITSIQNGIVEYSAASAFLTQGVTSFSPTAAALNTQRYGHTRTLTNASTAFIRSTIQFNLDGVAIDITLRIGLPQLEQGAFATSVIPTTTTALTRSADVASVNTLNPWYNATEGTLYGEISTSAINIGGVSRRIVNINDGTETNRITLGKADSYGIAIAFVTDNSVTQAAFTAGIGGYPLPTKVALAYKAADFQAAVNGSAFATVSSGTVPTVNRMTIGDVVTGSNGTQNINGHIRRITYYPRRLSQAELTAITA